MKRFLVFLFAFFLLSNAALVFFFAVPLPKTLQDLRPTESLKILDRNGQLLYEVLPEDGGRRTFLPLSEMPPDLPSAFLAAEDKRFFEHPGVDVVAVLRAIWLNVRSGEIVSGGSTITQQLIRNLLGYRRDASVWRKAKESFFAIKLSTLKDKDKVMEAYLNTIYFGGLAYGVEAASQQYFGKSARNLDLAESAFLAGLPQSPVRNYPFEHFEEAKKRQEVVLKAMLDDGLIAQAEHDAAKEELIRLQPKKTAKRAPHFVDYVFQSIRPSPLSEIKTTLDLGLQEQVESLVESYLSFARGQGIGNASVVILDPSTGDLLSMVGSADYFNASIDGSVNVATSLRQPGSALKPILYAAAIEKGWTADTLIADEPVQFQTDEGMPYEPKNYDLEFHGTVTVAQALARSLNVPAVKTLSFVGMDSFLRTLRDFGLTTLDQPASFYGLSLALGSGEVRLLELTSAFGPFANNGQRCPIRTMANVSPSECSVVLSPKTAKTIAAILSDNELRMPEFGEENPLHFDFPVAAKTGTSRNFRDNWTMGFTDQYVVGVWAGNSSGEPMEGASGISGAGPLFAKVMMALHEKTDTKLTVDPAFVPKATGPISLTPTIAPLPEFRIIAPFAGDQFLFDPNKPAKGQQIKLEASQEAEWFVDGKSVGKGTFAYWTIVPGEHVVRAVREGEEPREVMITVR